MRILNITLFFLFLASQLISQNKRDYVWLFGDDQQFEPGIQALRYDFNKLPLKFEVAENGLQFGQNNAFICDTEGNLLFYSNGCAIANSNHEVMVNGDSINAGKFFDLFEKGECGFGYPGNQNITILTDPGNENGYYLIHKTHEYEPDLDPPTFIKYLKYSYIDMSLHQGLGEVVSKNIPFLEAKTNLLSSYLCSINHQNGEDFWILQPKKDDNVYYRILLTDSGFAVQDSQRIGPVFHWNASASGSAQFSPDGKTYAYFNTLDGLLFYDFNRESGLLSNLRQLTINDPSIFSGIEYSPNSRFLYLITQDTLWQVDTHEQDLKNGLELIDVWNGINDPISTQFYKGSLGPDCRIYIRPGSSSLSFHVINNPDKKGEACDFVQQGIKLPQYSSAGSFPYFPRFRIDDQEICDSSLTSLFGEPILIRKDLNIYPNPASSHIDIKLPNGFNGWIRITNMSGQPVVSTKFVSGNFIERVDISGFPDGTYSVEYLPKNNKERLIYSTLIQKLN